jgi:hypothetical protein
MREEHADCSQAAQRVERHEAARRMFRSDAAVRRGRQRPMIPMDMPESARLGFAAKANPPKDGIGQLQAW